MFTLSSFFCTLILFYWVHKFVISLIELKQILTDPNDNYSKVIKGVGNTLGLAILLGLLTGLHLTHHPSSSHLPLALEVIKSIVLSIFIGLEVLCNLGVSKKLYRLTGLSGSKLLIAKGAQFLVFVLLFLVITL